MFTCPCQTFLSPQLLRFLCYSGLNLFETRSPDKTFFLSVVSMEYFATVWRKLGLQKQQANGIKLVQRQDAQCFSQSGRDNRKVAEVALPKRVSCLLPAAVFRCSAPAPLLFLRWVISVSVFETRLWKPGGRDYLVHLHILLCSFTLQRVNGAEENARTLRVDPRSLSKNPAKQKSFHLETMGGVWPLRDKQLITGERVPERVHPLHSTAAVC